MSRRQIRQSRRTVERQRRQQEQARQRQQDGGYWATFTTGQEMTP